MSDVTRILSQINDGDPQAAEQLLPLVYNELCKLARAKMAVEDPGQTLQATALVHEAYIRLVDVEKVQRWNSRGHFFAAAAEAMRRILVENARRKGRLKRGGGFRRHNLEIAAPSVDPCPDDILALSEAIDSLAREHPEKAELVTRAVRKPNLSRLPRTRINPVSTKNRVAEHIVDWSRTASVRNVLNVGDSQCG